MSSLGNKFNPPAKYQEIKSSIWEEFANLALENDPIDLAQGFPDFIPSQNILKTLAEVAEDENVLLHQYTRGHGHIRLVNVLSKLYSKVLNRDIDPLNEIITTVGAFEALYCAIHSNINDGDEVILIEPFFDCYEPIVTTAGGKCVFVPLRPTKSNGKISSNDWKLDEEEFSNAFSSKTKIIILNNPHNPTGKVFTEDELTVVANLCKKYNVLCISDEVYEWIIYNNKHIRIASLPDMWERTITIGTAGKIFNVTGWRTGWAYGTNKFIKNMQVIHQNFLNSINTPAQEAIARLLEIELENGQEFNKLVEKLLLKRDYMVKFLTDIGMIPTIPEGGYFILVDWTPLANKIKFEQENDEHKDFKFAKWVSKNLKVQGIPPSAFYSSSHKNLGENYIRFCFIKNDLNIKKAENILKAWACS